MNVVEDSSALPQTLAPLNVSEARKRRRQNRLNPIKNVDRRSDIELKDFNNSDVSISAQEINSALPICTSPESSQVDDSISAVPERQKRSPLRSPNVAEENAIISRSEELSEEELEDSEEVHIESRRQSDHQNKLALKGLMSHKKLTASSEPLEPVEIKVKKHKKEKRKKIKHLG